MIRSLPLSVQRSHLRQKVDYELTLCDPPNLTSPDVGSVSLAAVAPRLRKPQLSKVVDRLITLSSGGAGKEESLRDVASLGESPSIPRPGEPDEEEVSSLTTPVRTVAHS